jgi:hypothetical protein
VRASEQVGTKTDGRVPSSLVPPQGERGNWNRLMKRLRPNAGTLRHALLAAMGLATLATTSEALARPTAASARWWWSEMPALRQNPPGGTLAAAHPFDVAPGLPPPFGLSLSAGRVTGFDGSPSGHASRADPPAPTTYRFGTSQSLLADIEAGEELSLYSHFSRDPRGRQRQDLGLRYRQRIHDQAFSVGVMGGLENGGEAAAERRRVGAELSTAPFELRANLFDDVVTEGGGHRSGPDRMLDGYDVEVGAQLPFLPWAWLKANRFWQITSDGDSEAVADSFSLRLKPLEPLEIETGTVGTEDDRSWFAQLRFRLRLGGPR